MKEKIVNREKINEADLVSVIIPLYNNEKLIEKCLNSLINQTYGNCEIIVVDDCSTDGSLSIVKRLAEKDGRIKWYSDGKKTGVSAVRNAGIGFAHGDYICFVDSDDYVSEDYVECLITAIKHTGADVCAVDYCDVSEKQNKKFKKKFNYAEYVVESYDKVSAMEQLFSGNKLRMNIWNKMYPRRIFEGEDKVEYCENIYHGEDVSFLYDVFVRSEKVVYVPKKCYAYTHRKGSLVRSVINPKKFTYLDAVKYAADKCAKELPAAFVHVAGWRAMVNIEIIYYMLRDGYFDYDTYNNINETFKNNIKFVPKGKRHRVYRRIFVPVAARVLSFCYKIKFKKEIRDFLEKKDLA